MSQDLVSHWSIFTPFPHGGAVTHTLARGGRGGSGKVDKNLKSAEFQWDVVDNCVITFLPTKARVRVSTT